MIGREHERAWLAEALSAGEVRLETITGAGGSGKTRLALAVAEAIVGDLADGAFFVPSAEVPTSEGVLAAIAAPLGIRLQADRDPGETVAVALAGRKLLLVLDGFEHLVGAGSMIATLLAAAPALRVLVTSQAPLRLQAERVLALRSLEAPPTDDEAGVEASSAGRLLLDRACRGSPGAAFAPRSAAPLRGRDRRIGTRTT